jgi:hypothetical protein
MALLHWSVSRSIFLIQVGALPVDSEEGMAFIITTVGYSSTFITVTLVIGGALIPVLLAFSLRKFGPGMPLANSCSIAISAASHAADDEPDVALWPVQYSVLRGITTTDGRQRVGFSSEEVDPLVNGVVYN